MEIEELNQFIEENPETRELSYEELKNLKALHDTSLRFNFSDEFAYGITKCNGISGIYKTNKGLWISWTNQDNKVYNLYLSNNITEICHNIIRSHLIESVSKAIGYYNTLLSYDINNYTHDYFAYEWGYTIGDYKEKKVNDN